MAWKELVVLNFKVLVYLESHSLIQNGIGPLVRISKDVGGQTLTKELLMGSLDIGICYIYFFEQFCA